MTAAKGLHKELISAERSRSFALGTFYLQKKTFDLMQRFSATRS
jgi:hypothetical protein